MTAPITRLENGSATSPLGFQAGAVHAGIKSDPSRLDLMLLYSERRCTVAATFTQNRFAAAPVILDRERVRSGAARAIVANSGNANACTGDLGLANARQMARWAASKLGIPEEEVLVASTGIIGVHLPVERIETGIGQIALSSDGGIAAARGIMTTDTRPKHIALEIMIDGRPVRIGGMSKGAGMIHPNMATMLCFITSDAQASANYLRTALGRAVADSFNMISVDGDTSTNDTCLLLANGASGVAVDEGGVASQRFEQALTEVAQYLAHAIVADAEGAQRTMQVEVVGAPDEDAARLVARSIASSSLFKAAVHGGDPNWGRILCAAGYAGAPFDPAVVELSVGGVALVRDGAPLEFDQAAAARAMAVTEVEVRLDLHQGSGRAVAWGCELTEEYVVENSAYTT